MSDAMKSVRITSSFSRETGEENLPYSIFTTYLTTDFRHNNNNKNEENKQERWDNLISIEPPTLTKMEDISCDATEVPTYFYCMDDAYDMGSTNTTRTDLCSRQDPYVSDDTGNYYNIKCAVEGSTIFKKEDFHPNATPAVSLPENETNAFFKSDDLKDAFMTINSDFDVSFLDTRDKEQPMFNVSNENFWQDKGTEDLGTKVQPLSTRNTPRFEPSFSLTSTVDISKDTMDQLHLESNPPANSSPENEDSSCTFEYKRCDYPTLCDVWEELTVASNALSHTHCSCTNPDSVGASYFESNPDHMNMHSFQNFNISDTFQDPYYEKHTIKGAKDSFDDERLATKDQLSINHDSQALSELMELIPDTEDNLSQDVNALCNSDVTFNPENFENQASPNLDGTLSSLSRECCRSKDHTRKIKHCSEKSVKVFRGRKLVLVYIRRPVEPYTKPPLRQQQQRATCSYSPWDSILSEEMLAESVCTPQVKAKSLVSVDKARAEFIKKHGQTLRVNSRNIHAFLQQSNNRPESFRATSGAGSQGCLRNILGISDAVDVAKQNLCVPQSNSVNGQTEPRELECDGCRQDCENLSGCSMTIVPSETLSKFSETRQISIDNFTRQLQKYMPRFLKKAQKSESKSARPSVNKIPTILPSRQRLSKNRSSRFGTQMKNKSSTGGCSGLNSNNNANNDMAMNVSTSNKGVRQKCKIKEITFIEKQDSPKFQKKQNSEHLQKHKNEDHRGHNYLNHVPVIKDRNTERLSDVPNQLKELGLSLLKMYSSQRPTPHRSMCFTILKQLRLNKESAKSEQQLRLARVPFISEPSAGDKESSLPRLSTARNRYRYKPSALSIPREQKKFSALSVTKEQVGKRSLRVDKLMDNHFTKQSQSKLPEKLLNVRRAKEQMQQKSHPNSARNDSCQLLKNLSSGENILEICPEEHPQCSSNAVHNKIKLHRQNTKISQTDTTRLLNINLNSNKNLESEDSDRGRNSGNVILDEKHEQKKKDNAKTSVVLSETSSGESKHILKLSKRKSVPPKSCTMLSPEIARIVDRLSTRPPSASSKLLHKIQRWEQEFRKPFNLKQELEELIHMKTFHVRTLAEARSHFSVYNTDASQNRIHSDLQHLQEYNHSAGHFKSAVGPKNRQERKLEPRDFSLARNIRSHRLMRSMSLHKDETGGNEKRAVKNVGHGHPWPHVKPGKNAELPDVEDTKLSQSLESVREIRTNLRNETFKRNQIVSDTIRTGLNSNTCDIFHTEAHKTYNF